MSYILSERFLLTGLLFINIFNLTNPFSKFLLEKSIDLFGAVNYIEQLLFKIEEQRNNCNFQLILVEKENLIQSRNRNYFFTSLIQPRERRIKKNAWRAFTR